MKKELTDHGKTLALKLFSRYRSHVSIRILLEHKLGRTFLSSYYRFTGLHYASLFGLVEVARALIEVGGIDINCMDDTGSTPLIWAVFPTGQADGRPAYRP